MSFNTVSALEIPQQATELTTEELKQICGGWNCDNNHNNHKNNNNRHCHQHQENHCHHHNECDNDH